MAQERKLSLYTFMINGIFKWPFAKMSANASPSNLYIWPTYSTFMSVWIHKYLNIIEGIEVLICMGWKKLLPWNLIDKQEYYYIYLFHNTFTIVLIRSM